MKKTRRILGLILALSLAAGSLAMSVAAEEAAAADDTTAAATTEAATDEAAADDADAATATDAAAATETTTATATTEAAAATTTPAAPVAPAAPVVQKPVEYKVNTLAFEMKDGKLTGTIDGKALSTIDAKEGKLLVGMSDDGRLWVTTDDKVKKIIAINPDKDVEVTVAGVIDDLANDPTFDGLLIIDKDAQVQKLRVTNDATSTIYGNVAVLSMKNNAKVVAAKDSKIGTAYLYNLTSVLSMREGSNAKNVKTNYRNENVKGKANIDSITQFS